MAQTFEGGFLLLIFVRNPRLGKVKTRLARDVGDSSALKIYEELLRHTAQISLGVQCFRWVFYDVLVEKADAFSPSYFMKGIQKGKDLGERMSTAFTDAFLSGYSRVLCIGSDCMELTTAVIADAFEVFQNSDFVIGPAFDGGYYLIGMKKMYPPVFIHKEWGESNVLLDTLLEIKNAGLSYSLLPTLRDVDTLNDLDEHLRKYMAE